jgi:hypothetical protein
VIAPPPELAGAVGKQHHLFVSYQELDFCGCVATLSKTSLYFVSFRFTNCEHFSKVWWPVTLTARNVTDARILGLWRVETQMTVHPQLHHGVRNRQYV